MPGPLRQSIWQGAGPQALQGARTSSGRAGAYPLETYQTPILDLTKTYSSIELVPARPGYIACPRSRLWIVTFQAGVQTTPPTIRAGSDPAHQNYINPSGANPTNVAFNAGVTPPWIITAQASQNNHQLFQNATVFLDVTVPGAGTGGYKLLAMLLTTVEWVSPEVGQ